MPKVSKHALFFKVHLSLLDAGLDWHQAGVLHYIERLTAKGLPCFASAETIGEELRIPYGTVRRVIDSLISSKYLQAKKIGRKRILSLTPVYFAALEGVQIEHLSKPDTAHSEHLDTAQIEQLPRSNLPRSKDLDLNINKLDLGNNLDLGRSELDLGSLTREERNKLEWSRYGINLDDLPE
jgi:DNA-binding MarR family transcriptional regulator